MKAVLQAEFGFWVWGEVWGEVRGEVRVVWHFLSVVIKGSRVALGELSAVDGWWSLEGTEYSKLPTL